MNRAEASETFKAVIIWPYKTFLPAVYLSPITQDEIKLFFVFSSLVSHTFHLLSQSPLIIHSSESSWNLLLLIIWKCIYIILKCFWLNPDSQRSNAGRITPPSHSSHSSPSRSLSPHLQTERSTTPRAQILTHAEVWTHFCPRLWSDDSTGCKNSDTSAFVFAFIIAACCCVICGWCQRLCSRLSQRGFTWAQRLIHWWLWWFSSKESNLHVNDRETCLLVKIQCSSAGLY